MTYNLWYMIYDLDFLTWLQYWINTRAVFKANSFVLSTQYCYLIRQFGSNLITCNMLVKRAQIDQTKASVDSSQIFQSCWFYAWLDIYKSVKSIPANSIGSWFIYEITGYNSFEHQIQQEQHEQMINSWPDT